MNNMHTERGIVDKIERPQDDENPNRIGWAFAWAGRKIHEAEIERELLACGPMSPETKARAQRMVRAGFRLLRFRTEMLAEIMHR